LEGAVVLHPLIAAGRISPPANGALPSLLAYEPCIPQRVRQLSLHRGFVSFDVDLKDGGRASNRRVSTEDLGGLDGDQLAHDLIEQQEAEISRKAAGPPHATQSLTRASKPEPKLVAE